MDKDKSDYLIQWRQGLWAQIRQKEDAIWRFISFYAAAIILAAGAVQQFSAGSHPKLLTPFGALLIVLTLTISTFWGLLIVLDANFWLQRNLIFVRNVEAEFLPTEDFGKLLPKSFRRAGSFRYDRSYTIHSHILFFTTFLILCAYIGIAINAGWAYSTAELALAGAIAVTFCLGLLYVSMQDREWIADFITTRLDAPGKSNNTSKEDYNREIEEAIQFWSSHITIWTLTLSWIGSALLLVVAYECQTWFVLFQQGKVGVAISFAVVTVLCIFVYVFAWTRSRDLEVSSRCRSFLIRSAKITHLARIVLLGVTALVWISLIVTQIILPFLCTI